MDTRPDPVYSHNVVEFIVAANEDCKYAEHASELKGDEMLKIMQRILPLLYLKVTLLPVLEPVFEDGNEKFVTETEEVINDAVWECRMNFETLRVEKLLNTIRTIHNFLYSGRRLMWKSQCP